LLFLVKQLEFCNGCCFFNFAFDFAPLTVFFTEGSEIDRSAYICLDVVVLENYSIEKL